MLMNLPALYVIEYDKAYFNPPYCYVGLYLDCTTIEAYHMWILDLVLAIY